MSELEKNNAAYEMEALIIDATGEPLDHFLKREPTPRAIIDYIWLNVLRPVLVVLFWIVLAVYTYRHLFSLPVVLENRWLLVLYISMVTLITFGMLYLALFRRRNPKLKRGANSHVSTGVVADSMNLPAEDLEQWQAARLVVAHHDGDGLLEKVDVLIDGDGKPRRPLRRKARKPPMADGTASEVVGAKDVIQGQRI